MVGFQGWWREVRLAEADVGLAAGLAELADAVRQREQALVDVPAFAPLQLADAVFSRLCSQATAHVLTRCYMQSYPYADQLLAAAAYSGSTVRIPEPASAGRRPDKGADLDTAG